MANINQLARTDTLTDDDLLPVWVDANQDTRRVTLPLLASYVRQSLEGDPDETIYSLTTSGGTFAVAVMPAASGGSVWAQLTLSGAASSGTVILPGIDDRANGQEVLVTITQAVAALTVSGNGAAVRGAPTSLSADGFFKLRFDSISTTWFRVG